MIVMKKFKKLKLDSGSGYRSIQGYFLPAGSSSSLPSPDPDAANELQALLVALLLLDRQRYLLKKTRHQSYTNSQIRNHNMLVLLTVQ